jgi:hypothetical protein
MSRAAENTSVNEENMSRFCHSSLQLYRGSEFISGPNIRWPKLGQQRGNFSGRKNPEHNIFRERL